MPSSSEEYRYEAGDDRDCEYKALLWRDLDDTTLEQLYDHNCYFGNNMNDKVLLYKLSIGFMYKYNGRLRKHRDVMDITDLISYHMGPPPSAYLTDHSRTALGSIGQGNSTNLPIGMSTYLGAYINEESVAKAMFRDISNFARHTFQSAVARDHPDPDLAARNVIIVRIMIQIITLQREDEKLLTSTEERCFMSTAMPRVESFLSVHRKEENLPSIYHINNKDDQKQQQVKSEEGDCCSICLQELKCSPSGYLPCTHIFHFHCIVKWLWRSNCCPLCRAAYRRLVSLHDQFPLIASRMPRECGRQFPLIASRMSRRRYRPYAR